MPSLFSRIIAGEIPCYKIYEDEWTFAFLDIRPHTLWHTLVIPKVEIDYFVDLPEPYYSAVFQTAKKISPALKEATWCIRVGAIIAWFDVPHFHYHLIPMNTYHDLNSGKAHDETPEAMEKIHKKILAHL